MTDKPRRGRPKGICAATTLRYPSAKPGRVKLKPTAQEKKELGELPASGHSGAREVMDIMLMIVE